ncbi:hypothetical protein XENOCAPTIV_023075, partial [Xenoophorus captivus]
LEKMPKTRKRKLQIQRLEQPLGIIRERGVEGRRKMFPGRTCVPCCYTRIYANSA